MHSSKIKKLVYLSRVSKISKGMETRRCKAPDNIYMAYSAECYVCMYQHVNLKLVARVKAS